MRATASSCVPRTGKVGDVSDAAPGFVAIDVERQMQGCVVAGETA
jgi:hypothetical protein